MSSPTKEFSTERMRYLLYEINEVLAQKLGTLLVNTTVQSNQFPKQNTIYCETQPSWSQFSKIPRMGYRLQLGILRGFACEGRRRKRNGYLSELWQTALLRDTI